PIPAGYKAARYNDLVRRLRDRLEQIPGVRAVTFSDNGLFSGRESADTIKVEGFAPKADRDRVSWEDQVGPGYFGIVGVPLLLGRDIGPQDNEAAPRVAVVNEAFAKFYFGSQTPIGHKFYLEDSGQLGP